MSDEQHAHKHWGCPECGNIVHDEKGEYVEGDNCPSCFIGKLVEAKPMPSIEEASQMMQKPTLDYMKSVEAARNERSDRQHEEMMAIARRGAEAAESQAETMRERAMRDAVLFEKLNGLIDKYLNPPPSPYPTAALPTIDETEWRKRVEEEAEQRRQDKALRMRMNSDAVAAQERQAAALEAVAQALAALAAVVATDDVGRAAVRVIGEFVGGEGDVPAGP